MGGIVLLIIAIFVITTVVGVIAKVLNKMNEAAVPPPRRPAREMTDGTRQSNKDMDRFLAEIDRLRRKNAESTEPTAAAPAPAKPAQRPLKPVPVSRGNRSERQKTKGKAVAELAEPQRRRVDSSAMAAPPAPVAPGTLSPDAHTKLSELPVATVVGATSSTGAPAATRVTRLPTRARPTPKTNLAMNLTGLLNSGQGVAMAVILQEILGPPKGHKQPG
jgi:hypothetical protein